MPHPSSRTVEEEVKISCWENGLFGEERNEARSGVIFHRTRKEVEHTSPWVVRSRKRGGRREVTRGLVKERCSHTSTSGPLVSAR